MTKLLHLFNYNLVRVFGGLIQYSIHENNAIQNSNNTSTYNENSETKHQNTNNSNYPNTDNYTNNGLKGKFPIASTRLLTHNDLKNLSKYELKIMRNEIFARHGYIFRKGGKMDKYFKQTDWYQGKHSNVNDLLSRIEQKNIKLIQQYEK